MNSTLRDSGSTGRFSFAAAALLVAFPGASSWASGTERAAQTILYVDAGVSHGGAGTSWGDALDSLQDALALAPAVGADEIWVAAGTYLPSRTGDVRESFVLRDGLAIYGGFAGGELLLSERDPLANPTFLSGDLAGDDLPGFVNYGENSEHVVRATGVGPTAVLDGFEVRSGFASVVGQDVGAGIWLVDSAPTIRDVILRENLAVGPGARGAGLYASRPSGLVVTRCTFERNGALAPATIANNTKDGGGAYVLAGAATFVDCSFRFNEAIVGSAVAAIRAELHVVRTTFADNTATSGTAYVEDGLRPSTFVSSTFEDNLATVGGGIDVFESGVPTLVRGCAFRRNQVTAGGGVHTFDSDLVIEDSGFFDNRVTSGGGVYVSSSASVVNVAIRRSVFRLNRLARNAGLGRMGGAVGIHGFDTGGPNVVIEDSELVQNVLSQVSLVRGGSVRIDGCTLYRPVVATLVDVVSAGTAQVTNSIVWNPLGASPLKTSGAGTLTIDYSCVAGGAAGVGNIADDPLFVDVGAADLRLTAASPCLDAGDPASVPVRLDVNGDPRALDGNLDGVLVRDMGADELNALRLDVTRGAGRALTVQTSGAPGLTTILGAGAPGSGHFFPGVGAVFFDFEAPFVRAAWGSVPSTRSLVIPEGLAFPVQFQALGLGPAGRTASNPVPLAPVTTVN